jgi:hypothetical protein
VTAPAGKYGKIKATLLLPDRIITLMPPVRGVLGNRIT